MTKLPSQSEIEAQLEQEFDLELCSRDHALLEKYNLPIFSMVVTMVAKGITPDQIRKWVERRIKNEPLVVQRVANAARYEQGLQVK